MKDLAPWLYYIETHIGFVLPQAQRRWLINAVDDTARHYQLTTTELWHRITHDDEARQLLLDRVLIPESRFFRHPPSLDFISKQASAHQRRDTTQTDYRIWSVGCATGQEVWSLAMSLQKTGVHHYQLLGTDVSTWALEQAQAGRYTHRQIQDIPKTYRHFIQPSRENHTTSAPALAALTLEHQDQAVCQYLKQDRTISYPSQSYTEQHHASQLLPSMWQVTDALRTRISYQWHNLFAETPAVHLPQHAILCQNVLIYFRQFDQRDILARLVQQCSIGGHLILAPGEALFWQHPAMKKVHHSQVNVWQKVKE